MKLSRWFPPNEKPTIEGLYQTRVSVGNGRFRMLWRDGCWWLPLRYGRVIKAYFQDREWRGLAEKPKGV